MIGNTYWKYWPTSSTDLLTYSLWKALSAADGLPWRCSPPVPPLPPPRVSPTPTRSLHPLPFCPPSPLLPPPPQAAGTRGWRQTQKTRTDSQPRLSSNRQVNRGPRIFEYSVRQGTGDGGHIVEYRYSGRSSFIRTVRVIQNFQLWIFYMRLKKHTMDIEKVIC